MIEFFMIGNLGGDAVLNMANGKPVINFSVCRIETWKKRMGEDDSNKKIWVDCAYYVDNPELLKLLSKGTQVFVKGTPSVKMHYPKGGDPFALQHLTVSKVDILSIKKRDSGITSTI